jgi:hypothetical protein
MGGVLLGLFKKKEKINNFSVYLHHVSGLPLAENSSCTLSVVTDTLTISSGNAEFVLKLDQISVVDFKLDVEIAQIVSSSAAKGIAGGIMFGPIGAIIGSRATSKEKRTVTGYLIINYTNSKGELTALIFTDVPSCNEAAKFVDKLRPLIANNPKKSFQL